MGKVSVVEAYISGIVYLSDGEIILRKLNGNIVKTGKTSFDPKSVKYDPINPLAEKDRKFDNLKEALDYADAITAMQRLINFAKFSEDPILPASRRNNARVLVSYMQEEIRQRYLDVLKNHKEFGKLENFIEGSPENMAQILDS